MIRRRAARLGMGLAGALLAALLAACAGPPGSEQAASAAPPRHAAYVVRRGWHTDIALSRAAILATGAMPEAADFPDAPLLEFGWGDRAYYMAAAPGPGLALRAALAPTPAVLHVAPVWGFAPGADRAPLTVSPAALDALIRAVAASFERSGADAAAPLGPGLPAGAWFYPATGRFHLFNTCNSWTARMLAAAGLAVEPGGPPTAGALMRQVRRLPQSDRRASGGALRKRLRRRRAAARGAGWTAPPRGLDDHPERRFKRPGSAKRSCSTMPAIAAVRNTAAPGASTPIPTRAVSGRYPLTPRPTPKSAPPATARQPGAGPARSISPPSAG